MHLTTSCACMSHIASSPTHFYDKPPLITTTLLQIQINEPPPPPHYFMIEVVLLLLNPPPLQQFILPHPELDSCPCLATKEAGTPRAVNTPRLVQIDVHAIDFHCLLSISFFHFVKLVFSHTNIVAAGHNAGGIFFRI